MTDDDTEIPIDADSKTILPAVELLTGRGFITGKSGSGKSNTASVIVEELLDRGFPLLIVDTDGEYWGLKEAYEILHVGADDECDLRVGPEHADKLADLALTDGVPIILDVSGFLDEAEASALVRETALALFARAKKQKQPFLLLVEEVHEYIPESGSVDETGQALVKIGKRGRKHGLGVAGISQRPADVKKDFITQANWLVWHRLTWDNDTKVVRRVVDADTSDAVASLADGEAFLQADFLAEDLKRVQVRRKRTFDAGATPDLQDIEQPELKSVSDGLVAELEDITDREQERQDRIAELEAKLESREQTIDELRDELEQARDMTEMAEQFSQALMQSADDDGEGGEVLQAEIDDIREQKNNRISELEAENESLREKLRELRETKRELAERVATLEEYERAVENMDELREAVRRMMDALGVRGGDASDHIRQKLQEREQRINDLQAKLQAAEKDGATVEPLADYDAFLNADAVEEQIEQAKEGATCSPRYIKGVLAAILQEGGAVDYDTIAERLGVSTTSDVSKAASELERRKLVTKDRRDGEMHVDLNTDGMNEVRQAAAEREKAEQLMNDL